MDEEVYRNDYETITGKLLFTYVPYETVIGGIEVSVEDISVIFSEVNKISPYLWNCVSNGK